MLTLATTLLTACANKEVIVPEPVVIEIPGPTVYVEVPRSLVIQHQPVALPERLSYGNGLLLWAEDRSNLDVCNAQLRAIAGLK